LQPIAWQFRLTFFDKHKQGGDMIIVIGEILIDRFPDYERIGGAPFNFAFHLMQMGLPVRLITRIGNDNDGRKISRLLRQSGFDLKDVQVDDGHATGTVGVSLDGKGVPRFDIREDAAYDHIELASVLPDNERAPAMIYFGTLIQRTPHGLEQVQQFLKKNASGSNCFCDINLRPPHINEEAIVPSLDHADILKLNDEELLKIASICNGPGQAKDAAAWLMQAYGIATIALTQGADGSTVITPARTFKSPPANVAKVVDTVGAGDAYASVLAAGLLKRCPVERVLEMAAAFAAQICRLPGAVPQDNGVYAPMIKELERISNAE
jgi:fructokinase